MLVLRHVNRDKISPREQLVQLDFLNTNLLGALLRQERIKGNHLHLHAQSPVSSNRTNLTATNHAQNLVVKLNAHKAFLLPLARMRALIGLWNLARQ